MNTTNMKKLTIESLKADGACAPGLAFVSPLIEDPELATKLLDEDENWWLWAAVHGYDVFSGLNDEIKARKGIYLDGEHSLKDATVFLVGGEAIVSSVESGTIEHVWGGTIKSVRGGTIKSVWGGTIESVRCGTIEYVEGGTIKCVWGGTIEQVRGGTIQSVRGGAIKSVYGGTIAEITGTATVVWRMFTPPSNVSDRAVVVHRNNDTVTVIGCGFKVDDRSEAA